MAQRPANAVCFRIYGSMVYIDPAVIDFEFGLARSRDAARAIRIRIMSTQVGGTVAKESEGARCRAFYPRQARVLTSINF
jgi:hypothetical protein